MDEGKYIRGLSDYELTRMLNIDRDRYTQQEIAIAEDEMERRELAKAPVESEEPEEPEEIEAPIKPGDAQPEAAMTREKNAKCDNCGREVPEEFTYCPDCGEQISTRKEIWQIPVRALVFFAALIICGVVWMVAQFVETKPSDPVVIFERMLEQSHSLNEAEFKKQCVFIDSSFSLYQNQMVYIKGIMTDQTHIRVFNRNGNLTEIEVELSYGENFKTEHPKKDDRVTVYGYIIGSSSYSNQYISYSYPLMYVKYVSFD